MKVALCILIHMNDDLWFLHINKMLKATTNSSKKCRWYEYNNTGSDTCVMLSTSTLYRSQQNKDNPVGLHKGSQNMYVPLMHGILPMNRCLSFRKKWV